MDKIISIDVWSSRQELTVTVRRYRDSIADGYRRKTVHSNMTKASAWRLTQFLRGFEPNCLNIHAWGIVSSWVIIR